MIKVWKLAVTNLIHILNMQVNILRYLLKKNSHNFFKIYVENSGYYTITSRAFLFEKFLKMKQIILFFTKNLKLKYLCRIFKII